jgi:hypothetical protein
MTTPLPFGLAPYISPLTLMNAPTGIDFTTIPPFEDATPAQNMAELWNMCARATAKVNGFCNQTLRATIDIEVVQGPDYRMTTGPGSGGSWPVPYWGVSPAVNTRVILSRWPVLQVTQVQVCPNGVWPRSWTTLPDNWAEPESPPVGVYGSVAPGSSGDGSQAILIGPGYISKNLGRNGYIIQVTYLNGWPHTEISANAAAGATTITVDDTTGWAITSYQGQSGASGTIKDSGQQEPVHVTAASTTSGPGTLTLSSALVYPHEAGTLLTTLPASIEQACIFFCAAEALTRGATSTTIHDVGGHAQSSGGDVSSLIAYGEKLIASYRRTV